MDSFSEFIKRVHTFTIEKWAMRHYKLTPLRLARWGFQFNTTNSIICQYCQEIISLEDYPFECDDLQDLNQYVQNLLQRIRKCHQENCLFHKIKDQNTLFKIGYKFIYLYAKKFYENNLMSYSNISELPQISPSFRELVPQTFQLVFSDSAKDLQENTINAVKCLSIFGWSCQIISDCEKSLQCQFCGRSVNFSQYDSCQNSQNLNASVEGKQVFDLFENHRYFCKWASLDNDSKKLNGYSILIQELYNDFLQSNPVECKQSKFNQVVQINVMRREIVSQLERIKKEQQNLNQTLNQIQEDNKQITQRISKRQFLNFQDMVNEDQIRDKIVKKIKLMQEKVILQSEDQKENLPLQNDKKDDDIQNENQKDSDVQDEKIKKLDQQAFLYMQDQEKNDNLQIQYLSQLQEQYEDAEQGQGLDLNQNEKYKDLVQVSNDKYTFAQHETQQGDYNKTQIQISVQKLFSSNVNGDRHEQQQNEEIKQDKGILNSLRDNQSIEMDDQVEEQEIQIEIQNSENHIYQVERTKDSIFQTNVMEGEKQLNNDCELEYSKIKQLEVVEIDQQNSYSEQRVSKEDLEIEENIQQQQQPQENNEKIFDEQNHIEIEPDS